MRGAGSVFKRGRVTLFSSLGDLVVSMSAVDFFLGAGEVLTRTSLDMVLTRN